VGPPPSPSLHGSGQKPHFPASRTMSPKPAVSGPQIRFCLHVLALACACSASAEESGLDDGAACAQTSLLQDSLRLLAPSEAAATLGAAGRLETPAASAPPAAAAAAVPPADSAPAAARAVAEPVALAAASARLSARGGAKKRAHVQTRVEAGSGGPPMKMIIVYILLALFMFAILIFVLSFFTRDTSGELPVGAAALLTAGGQREAAEDEIERRRNENLDEDMYTLVMATTVRDLAMISQSSLKLVTLKSSRLMVHVVLLLGTILLQATLVIQIKYYVTPQAVTGIRDTYGEYEFIMYGSNSSHNFLSSAGRPRGIAKYFDPSLFDTLDSDMKTDVCNIPFSELGFYMLVLFVWSLTCIAQIKKAVEYFVTLVVATPTVPSMDKMLAHTAVPDSEDDGGDLVIVGITPLLKALLASLILAPWLLITGFLLWLGSRWLAATNDFGNLVSNAVALEFILAFKDLAYIALVPERSKRDLKNTQVLPTFRNEPAGICVFLGTFLWGVVALVWVFVYIYKLQVVLPQYQWDVHTVCYPWLRSLLKVPS